MIVTREEAVLICSDIRSGEHVSTQKLFKLCEYVDGVCTNELKDRIAELETELAECRRYRDAVMWVESKYPESELCLIWDDMTDPEDTRRNKVVEFPLLEAIEALKRETD